MQMGSREDDSLFLVVAFWVTWNLLEGKRRNILLGTSWFAQLWGAGETQEGSDSMCGHDETPKRSNEKSSIQTFFIKVPSTWVCMNSIGICKFWWRNSFKKKKGKVCAEKLACENFPRTGKPWRLVVLVNLQEHTVWNHQEAAEHQHTLVSAMGSMTRPASKTAVVCRWRLWDYICIRWNKGPSDRLSEHLPLTCQYYPLFSEYIFGVGFPNATLTR